MGKWWRTWVKTDVGRQAHAQSQSNDTNRNIKASDGSDSDSDDEREEDGMQVDLDPNRDSGTLGKGDDVYTDADGDDGGVANLLKNL